MLQKMQKTHLYRLNALLLLDDRAYMATPVSLCGDFSVQAHYSIPKLEFFDWSNQLTFCLERECNIKNGL